MHAQPTTSSPDVWYAAAEVFAAASARRFKACRSAPGGPSLVEKHTSQSAWQAKVLCGRVPKSCYAAMHLA